MLALERDRAPEAGTRHPAGLCGVQDGDRGSNERVGGVVETLELVVDEGRPANAGRFFQLGHDLLVLLDELSDVPISWRVEELRVGSAVARIAAPQGTEDGRWLRLAVVSLEAIREGSPLPDDWSPDAVKVAHRFVEHGQPLDDAEDWVPPRLVLVGKGGRRECSVELTAGLGRKLADLQPFERRMPGAVRGTLVGLNVSRGNRASLRLPNRRIVRVSFETSLRGSLKDALYQQVELRGQARQDGDGRVFHVRAEDVEVLLKPSVRWADLFGIDPAFTGAASTEEHLEANRGEA